MIVLIVLLVAAAGIWIAIWRYNFEIDRQTLDECFAVVDKHMPTLVKQRARLVEYDAYGRALPGGWAKEIIYFIDTQIEAHLTPRLIKSLHRQMSTVVTQIDLKVAEAEAKHPAATRLAADATPAEYELFCADELRRSGWEAHRTQASGDQGVDVIAQKDGIRIVLQCKLYSQPVSNGAVQEIVAGKLHERAHHAAVVSNNLYTRSAKQLARTTGVLLLHHTDLSRIDELIRESAARMAFVSARSLPARG